MQSFYGGRTGASAVIVKRFDCIKADGAFKKITCQTIVINNKEYIIYPIIEKTLENHGAFTNWITIERNPNKSYEVANKEKEYTIEEKAIFKDDTGNQLEGMYECFEKGGETTSDIAYGELCIIDTVTNAQEQENPDNGKIFRRPIQFDPDDEYGGAEYIGQIVGPRGTTPKIFLKPYSNLPEESKFFDYNLDNQGLVPGKIINENNEEEFNDTIKYGWTNVEDGKGILGAQIGFQFPFLVQEFTALSSIPYDDQGERWERDNENKEYSKELIEQIDGQTHNFYKKYQITVPEGIHGKSIDNIKILKTIIPKGTRLYQRINNQLFQDKITTSEKELSPEILLSNDFLNSQDIYQYPGEPNLYFKKADLTHTKWIFGYRDYEETSKGKVSYETGDSYKGIDNIKLDGALNDAKLRINYSNNTTDTVNLGNLYIKNAGILILGEYNSFSEIENKKPEALGGDWAKGAAIIVKKEDGEKNLYIYDYLKSQWIDLGIFEAGASSVSAESLLYIGQNKSDDLQPDGVWFKTSENNVIKEILQGDKVYSIGASEKDTLLGQSYQTETKTENNEEITIKNFYEGEIAPAEGYYQVETRSALIEDGIKFNFENDISISVSEDKIEKKPTKLTMSFVKNEPNLITETLYFIKGNNKEKIAVRKISSVKQEGGEG